MNDGNALRQRVKETLDVARAKIRNHTGLYRDEHLPRDVLRICDEITILVECSPRLEEARRQVEHRCGLVAMVADRFADRDPALIMTARAQAIAAVDMLQDAVLELHKAAPQNHHPGYQLRKRGL